MKNSSLLLLCFCFAFSMSFAQEANWDLAVDQVGLVILDEKNEIKIPDHRAEFMWFTVSKEVTYIVKNSNGIEKASHFTLPEKLDPIYISHFPKERNYSHVYSRMEIQYAKAIITSKSGDKREVELKPKVEEIEMMMVDLEYLGTYDKFHFSIEGLSVGDKVSLSYSYKMPYVDNFYQLSCNRIFFHSDVPKLKYSMEINHHPELFAQLDSLSGAEPDTIYTTEELKYYQWSQDSLWGCIFEPGGRPHLELPYVIFSPMPYDLYYTVPKTFEPRFTPFYALYAQMREERHKPITLSINQGVNTKQYLQIRRFVENNIAGMESDTVGKEKLTKLHHIITDEFAYRDNMEFFTREDTRDPKIGDQVGGKTLRDLCRNDLYLALMLSLDLNYCTAYLSDNRSGILSDFFFTPMYDNDMLYSAIFNGDSVSFIYPKRARYGYYMNELPFYFENSRARLVHLRDYIKRDYMIEETFRQVYTPFSGVGKNIRTTQAAVQVNLQENTLDFQARVYLSGQFSTMTRGLYLYDHHQDKVNDLYNQKLWDMDGTVNVANESLEVKTKEAPFTAQLNTKFSVKDGLKVDGEKYSLKFNSWIKHILDKELKSENRQLDYHPDFGHRDTYVYFLQFDQDVSLLEKPDKIDINSDWLTATFQVEQMGPRSIKIESFYAITGKIPVQDMGDLQKVVDVFNQDLTITFK